MILLPGYFYHHQVVDFFWSTLFHLHRGDLRVTYILTEITSHSLCSTSLSSLALWRNRTVPRINNARFPNSRLANIANLTSMLS